MDRADTYLISTPLPGERGGGEHLSVVLSSPWYHAKGLAVVAPLRRGRTSAYKRAIYQHEFQPDPGAMPLDQDRVIDLGQVSTVTVNSLGRRAGRVAATALQRVDEAIPKQFQFAGPWEIRGAVWTMTRDSAVERAVLIMNDMALENERAVQYTALEHSASGLGEAMFMLDVDWLDQEQEPLSDDEQEALSDFLSGVFGVSRAAV